MEKFEALLAGKKGKKDDKEPESGEGQEKEELGLKKSAELKKEISDIVRGRNLDDLEISDLKQVLSKYKEMESVLDISSEKRMEGTVQEQTDMAREIMGEEFFGFQEVEKAFGIEISPEDIPEIPFSSSSLEKAKELNQFLVLRTDKASDGEPLTLQKINETLKGKVSDGSKLLYSDDGTGKLKSDVWYKDEDFIKTETPKLTWALTSKEVIPDSADKNYLNQTEDLVNYLKNEVFKEGEIPKEYDEGIKEFEREKENITKLMSSDWKKATEKLGSLKISRLTRQNPVEALYDMAIYFQNKGERILENKYTWTSCRGSDGRLVGVGFFGSGGACVNGSAPDDSHDALGVAFSRSL